MGSLATVMIRSLAFASLVSLNACAQQASGKPPQKVEVNAPSEATDVDQQQDDSTEANQQQKDSSKTPEADLSTLDPAVRDKLTDDQLERLKGLSPKELAEFNDIMRKAVANQSDSTDTLGLPDKKPDDKALAGLKGGLDPQVTSALVGLLGNLFQNGGFGAGDDYGDYGDDTYDDDAYYADEGEEYY